MWKTTSRLRAAIRTVGPIAALVLATGCGGGTGTTTADSTLCGLLSRADATTGPVSSGELPPEQMKAAIADSRVALSDLSSYEGSPTQVSADAQTLENEMSRLDALAVQYDYDLSKVPENAFAGASLGGPEVQDAGQRLEQARQKTCRSGGSGPAA